MANEGNTETVQLVPLQTIDFDVETYRFRADLRVGSLATSIAENGQQVPALLMRREDGMHVIVCGFRRSHAIRRNKGPGVLAIVRDQLTDEEAFRASLLENSQRKTYNELDRAIAARAARARGLGVDEWQTLLGCTAHQVRALERLLDLPLEVQVAVDDPAQHVTITHAIKLAQRKRKYPDLVWREWLDRINAERLSVQALIEAVNERYGRDEPTSVPSLFRGDETDEENGVFRFQSIKVEVGKLSREERMRLRAELSWVVAALDRAEAAPTTR